MLMISQTRVLDLFAEPSIWAAQKLIDTHKIPQVSFARSAPAKWWEDVHVDGLDTTSFCMGNIGQYLLLIKKVERC